MKMIDQDKANHALAGAAIVALLTPFAGLLLALAGCAAVALAKEFLYDAHPGSGHTVDWLDAVWTVLGGLVVAVSHLGRL